MKLLGEIRAFHSFNGVIPIPRGWMQCDGSVIGSSAYDAIHGSGAYASDGIASLLLHGKYTPNLTNKYIVGSASTTQDGTSTITSVGNASHQINIQHSHSHSHIWHTYESDISPSKDGAGTNLSVDSSGGSSWKGISLVDKSSNSTLGITGNTNTNAADALSTTQSVQPESIQFIHIIRVGL